MKEISSKNRTRVMPRANFLVRLLLAQVCAGMILAASAAQAGSTVLLATNEYTVNPYQKILVDDFIPQPYEGDSLYYYNRLEGDRGALNHTVLNFGTGQGTAIISGRDTWGGIWFGLNHPIREGLTVDFSAILPDQIHQEFQSQIVGLTVRVLSGTQGRRLKVELKNGTALVWSTNIILSGGAQTISSNLPQLGKITELVIVLDNASEGDRVVIDEISLTATTQITDVMQAAFVWSYGMLLSNWDTNTGLIRDKAKDASGEFDAIQATGTFAAATALATQLGVISHDDAVQIVTKIQDTLHNHIPRFHGTWPHWVKVEQPGTFTILENTEWSSVDTTIAAIALLDAQKALNLDTSRTIQFLREIDWDALNTPNGLSHGYTYEGELIPWTWDTFGGESWLIELAYATVNHSTAPLPYPEPPTANGSGFIDEMAWLLVLPPTKLDYWGTNWDLYRNQAAVAQQNYFTINLPTSCFAHLGLFGLSAGEVPAPYEVAKTDIYQAFGIGGRFSPPNDGTKFMGCPVVLPHYSAIIAILRPQEAIRMWAWLIDGPFSPLNNVESLMFPTNSNCEYSEMTWNHLKGSWNLSLQTLGIGRYLAKRQNQIPVLWLATISDPFLRGGYNILVPDGLLPLFFPVVIRK